MKGTIKLGNAIIPISKISMVNLDDGTLFVWVEGLNEPLHFTGETSGLDTAAAYEEICDAVESYHNMNRRAVLAIVKG